MPVPGDKHNDVEYALEIETDGVKSTMQVFSSPKPEVAERHIQRIVDDHNRTNGEDSMKFISFQKKEAPVMTGAPEAAVSGVLGEVDRSEGRANRVTLSGTDKEAAGTPEANTGTRRTKRPADASPPVDRGQPPL